MRPLQREFKRQLEQLLDPARCLSLARLKSYCLMESWLGLGNESTSVLEVGCGPGRFAALLASLGYRVTAVDPFSFPEWDIIKKRTAVSFMDQVRAEALPFESASFDHVTCIATLHYVANPAAALDEMRRVIRPGGRLVIRTVNKSNLFTLWRGRKLDPASTNLYAMDELKSLISERGFKIKQSYAYGFMPPILTDLWWYLMSVWIPEAMQRGLSACTPAAYRHNNYVLASAE